MILVIGYEQEPFPCYGAVEFACYLNELGFQAKALITKGATDLSKFDFELVIGINRPKSFYNIKCKYMSYIQDDCTWMHDGIKRYHWMFGYSFTGHDCPLPIPSQFFNNSNTEKEYTVASIMNKGEPIEDMMSYFGLNCHDEFTKECYPIMGLNRFKEQLNKSNKIKKWLDGMPLQERIVVERTMLFHNINEGLLRRQTVNWLKELGIKYRVDGLGWTKFTQRSQHLGIYSKAKAGLSINGWVGPHHRDLEILAMGLPCIKRHKQYRSGYIGDRAKYKKQQDAWFYDLINSCLVDRKVKASVPDISLLGETWRYSNKKELKMCIDGACK